MESSSYLVWIKRVLPLIVIVGIWFGWESYQKARIERENAYDARIAAATAQLYVGAVKFRADSLGYIGYRDSVLGSFELTSADLNAYATGDGIDPYRYKNYVDYLGKMIDSLYRFEDSTRKYPDSVLEKIGGKPIPQPKY